GCRGRSLSEWSRGSRSDSDAGAHRQAGYLVAVVPGTHPESAYPRDRGIEDVVFLERAHTITRHVASRRTSRWADQPRGTPRPRPVRRFRRPSPFTPPA